MAKALLLGCGRSREKRLRWAGHEPWPEELVTLDMNPNCGADMVWDLERRPLPFADEEFDELAAYDVLEHTGRQGDWRGWFDEMSEYHRILKPGGMFGIIVPVGQDAFADPGHTRFFSLNHFLFLTEPFYEAHKEVTDYRWYLKRYWQVEGLVHAGDHHLGVIMARL